MTFKRPSRLSLQIRKPVRCQGLAAVLLAWALWAIQGLRAEESTEYLQAIARRADKIVATLGIEQAATRERVHSIILEQYRWLHQVHHDRDVAITMAKSKASDPKVIEEGIAGVKTAVDVRVNERHSVYLGLLGKELTPAQVDEVKDGMTYGVMQITYDAYTKMLPELTELQKAYIKEQLKEARELAMDAGSSKEKHQWFGKYKGRINNYLSTAGYDLKVASKRLEGK